MTNRAEIFSQITNERRSIRGFRSDAVPEDMIRQIFSDALRAPSNCNTQPWFVHIATGQVLEQLRTELPRRFSEGDMSLDYPYDGKYDGVYKDRQYASAAALYDALGIPREEKAKRQTWFLRNFSFFDAPAVAFFTLPSAFGLREACDLGMFAQTVMLGITANGLGSCPQTALGFMAHAIKPALNIPEDQKLLFGLSFGYPNDDDPANKAVTGRASLEDIVRFNA